MWLYRTIQYFTVGTLTCDFSLNVLIFKLKSLLLLKKKECISSASSILVLKCYFILAFDVSMASKFDGTHSLIITIISFSKCFPYYQPHVFEFNYQKAYNRISSDVCDCKHWKHSGETDLSSLCLRRIPHDMRVFYLKRGENKTNVKRRHFFMTDFISKNCLRKLVWADVLFAKFNTERLTGADL